MKHAFRQLAFAGLASVATLGAHAQQAVSLNAARVGGPDVATLAKFYEQAFGLVEVNRVNLPGGQIEIILNFGANPAAAKANTAAQVVIMHRAEALADPVPHLIFNVASLEATGTAITGAGGKIGKAAHFGPITLGVATDPAGNQIELIQQPTP